MKSSSASVTSEQTSSGGLGGALWETFRGHDSERVGDVFKLRSDKVIDVHAGRTGRVLFAQAENIVGSCHVLSEPPSAPTTTGSGKDVGSFSRFHVVRFTAAGEKDEAIFNG